MSALAAMTFAHPWLLLGLAVLPVIWLLLRATPPAPEFVSFPPARLIFDMARTDETPARTPWWLLLLRLLIAALIVIALARPVINPGSSFDGSGPVVLIVDDGWAAAQHWDAQVESMTDIARRARRQDRNVVMLRTARPVDNTAPIARLGTAEEALASIGGMVPRAWAPDRAAAITALGDLTLPGSANVYWLSDGVASDADADLIETARRLGGLTVLRRDPVSSVMLVRPPASSGTRLEVAVERDSSAQEERLALRATGAGGGVLFRRDVVFAPGERSVTFSEDLPLEAMNAIERVEVEGRQSAGTVSLIDSGLRRFRVGLAGAQTQDQAQPLLADLYFLKRALQPFAELREGSISDLLDTALSIMMLPDVGRWVDGDRLRLADWIEKGGVLVRFAGPKLADNASDLVPVDLRSGGRSLEGTMSWAEPARLAAFPDNSPFAGLAIPRDVTIQRQVLAEPTLDLPERTWASLVDGTPLVTAERRGDGWLVLFHTTANTGWSNLPISGLFVEMLRRLSSLSVGISADSSDTQRLLAAQSALDGLGRRSEPRIGTRPLAEADLATMRVGPDHPPGLYGEDPTLRALNVGSAAPPPEPLAALPGGVVQGVTGATPERDLGPWLLVSALVLLLADALIALALRGMLNMRRLAHALPLMLAAGLLVPSDVRAQDAEAGVDPGVIDAALNTRLAYVLTGDERVDRMSAAGMFGLSEMMRARTSVEPDTPVALDVERDELIFYPLVYWPMVASQPALSDEAIRRLDRYLKTGGVVLFDTRDAGGPQLGRSQTSPGTARLRQLLARVDIGPLELVKEGHVLTRSFYLTQSFPGRYPSDRVWVEQLNARANDGVSPLLIGGADWAAAWAMDRDGRPVAALSGGNRRQREMAFRFGINLVMYALTGNYKSDQVHLPAILDRLGQ
ncbi:MAG: DUF4159 domain-containing protein [Minwuia sp.]|nr:DUF4159 domain-containing protein [Minwuia sp.]